MSDPNVKKTDDSSLKTDTGGVSKKDVIYRQDAIDVICQACSMEEDYHKCDGYPETSTWCDELVALRALPSIEPEDWMERNKERILQAGMDGREIEFRIGGRLFAIREKAQ